jgi:hypothetical protein
MRKNLLIVLITTAAFLACKSTNGNQAANVLDSFMNEADKEAARQQFKSTINTCVPLVSAVVPGGKIVKLDGDAQKQQVVDQFTAALVSQTAGDSEKSNLLVKAYYDDKGKFLPPCSGESAEYVVMQFAVQTNIINIVLGENVPLKLVPQPNT